MLGDVAYVEDALSPREREILGLVAAGRSNRGICGELWLSPKTVESHIRHILCKLRISHAPEDNRRVLAALAYLSVSVNDEASRAAPYR